jgi:redox-sensitive bicupin YhaK (pirin superfamily)
VFSDLAFSNELSPFLMFDYGAPKKFKPTRGQLGVGQHPHRGFETVTVAWQGQIEHGDSIGNRDVIDAGDVQWMTAARGIIHEEFHSTEFRKKGGVLEMCQIWVNLPAKHKMDPPRYQPLLAKDIPVVPLASECDDSCEADIEDGSVRIIAGNYKGTQGAALTFSPVTLYDITIQNDTKQFPLEVPDGHNAMIFVRKGGVIVGADGAATLGPQSVALMEQSGEKVSRHECNN